MCFAWYVNTCILHTYVDDTGPKIPLRRKQSHNHRVIDLTVTTGYWRDILLFDDGFGGLAFGKEFVFYKH